MNQEEQDLLFKDLSMRLPYGVKMIIQGDAWEDYDDGLMDPEHLENGAIWGLGGYAPEEMGYDGGWVFNKDNSRWVTDNGMFMPILRPLSDLTNPIMYNGKHAVAAELLWNIGVQGLADPFNKDAYGNYKGKFDLSTKTEDECTVITVDPFEDKRFEVLEISWSEDSLAPVFYTTLASDQALYGCFGQYDLFEMLRKLHFDTRQLIPKGLAIDVNTLETNPYE